MKLSTTSHHTASAFLKNGSLPTENKAQLDAGDSRFADHQLSDQMRDHLALDMGRARGDEDDRFGFLTYTPQSGNGKVQVRLYGDEQDGYHRAQSEANGVVKAEYTQFSSDSVRHVVVTENTNGTSFRAHHHDRGSADQGYTQTYYLAK